MYIYAFIITYLVAITDHIFYTMIERKEGMFMDP
jgi:hypothetical protein